MTRAADYCEQVLLLLLPTPAPSAVGPLDPAPSTPPKDRAKFFSGPLSDQHFPWRLRRQLIPKMFFGASKNSAPLGGGGGGGGLGWESMRMGGSGNTGDGLASQPRRYRVPGQPLLNRHQVGGVPRSPDSLFAQQEREPIRG